MRRKDRRTLQQLAREHTVSATRSKCIVVPLLRVDGIIKNVNRVVTTVYLKFIRS
jgi:hypothetical protein